MLLVTEKNPCLACGFVIEFCLCSFGFLSLGLLSLFLEMSKKFGFV